MKRIKEIIERHSTGKKVLLLFMLTNIVYAIMLLVTIPKTMAFSNGLNLLDMMPLGYDAAYIHTLFDTLGEEGRQVYLKTQLPVDMIYPFLFGVSYCLLMGYVLKKLNKLQTVYSYLCLLPVVAGTADYFENFGIVMMLNTYPDFSSIASSMTAVFSVIKSMITTLFFIALLISLLFLGLKKMRETKSRTN